MVCLDIHHILVKFQSVAVCICVGIAFSRFFDMKNLIKNGGSKLEILKTACGYNFRQNGILQWKFVNTFLLSMQILVQILRAIRDLLEKLELFENLNDHFREYIIDCVIVPGKKWNTTSK